MPGLTPEQIIALAPDANSAKTGKELSSQRKWQKLGQSDRAAWGECQGSGKEPYQTQIDLSEPAFKCSCPSRKFPCKHALGLFLLLASQPDVFPQENPPEWVSDWLEKRSRANQKPEAEKKKKTSTAENQKAQARRAVAREERVRLGLEDLDLWLSDLVRQGINTIQSRSQSFWEAPAARLVDAQAPGMARRVREMAGIPGSGEGWQERLLVQASKLFLLIRGYQQLTNLPQPTQADIRTQIGWTQDQEELLQQNGVLDSWLVTGKRVEEETSGPLGKSSFIKIQRTWLLGRETGRSALLLSFAAPGQMLNPGYIPGTSLRAELVFFPGGFPLRSLVKNQLSSPETAAVGHGFATLLDALHAWSGALAANPWLDCYPMLLNDVTPHQAGETWGVMDREKRFLPFTPGSNAEILSALSGGYPLDIFGEWNGDSLLPLSAWAKGRFIPLPSALMEGQA